MELPKVIDQLKELIADRESFIYSDGEARRIYIADKEALEEAVKVQYVMAAEQQFEGPKEGLKKQNMWRNCWTKTGSPSPDRCGR